MKMKLLTLLGVFVLAKGYKPLKCPPNFVWSNRGCIKDCKSHYFENCPEFNQINNQSNFCGLNEDGEWIQFSQQCQACSTPGVIGVVQGSCDETKGFLRKKNQKKSRQLIPIRCPENRPSRMDCPDQDSGIRTQLDFCGVTEDGIKRGYNLPCSACRDQTIKQFYLARCQRVQIKALQRPVAKEEDEARDVQLSQPHHKDNFCFQNQCCQDWEFCLQKKCVDKCALMKCANGCVRGSCKNQLQIEN